ALPTTVAAGQNTSLTTNVDTSAAGSLSGELSFATNDADENPFDFPISATVTATATTQVQDGGTDASSAPDIRVLDGTNAIADGTTTRVGFGSVEAGGTLSKTFTVNNTGNAPLDLSNPTLPAGFSLAGTLPTTLSYP
ncbi:MAG: DUF1573 domain-containing protein, partial [Oscillatoria sp. SIO1A7]|nr:DUF1573 domain-containing protein [Oscillatoria sp. SIO1A7]